MPFGSEGLVKGIGLAMSGGGFRATLFHCGSLWRLNELGFLPQLDRISAVSGGSITAGMLSVAWPKLTFTNGVATNLYDEVIGKLCAFCSLNIDAPAIAEGTFLPWRTISDSVQEEYEKHLYGNISLQGLVDKPRFIFNSTNFSTGVDFRFSKPYAGDYRIGLIDKPDFSLALAVTASSAFPPFLSPVVIELDPKLFTKVDGADLFDHLPYRKKLVLTDGGAYDNLGMEPVWKRLETVLVSDAGAPFGFDPDPGSSWHRQSLRAFDIATSQARGLRKRRLIEMYQNKNRKGTYWGITTDIKNYALGDSLPANRDNTEPLARIRTRLNSFNEAEQCSLINWGYAVCDAAMRKHVLASAAPQPNWPYPKYSLDRPLDPGVQAEANTDLLDTNVSPR
jgi:NTE family protein